MSHINMERDKWYVQWHSSHLLVNIIIIKWNEMKWKQKIGHEVETIRYEFIQEMAASFFFWLVKYYCCWWWWWKCSKKFFPISLFFWLVQSGYHHLSSTGFEKIRFYWFKFFLDDDYTHTHSVCVLFSISRIFKGWWFQWFQWWWWWLSFNMDIINRN